MSASIANVRRWAHACFTEATPIHAFASLQIPVMLMTGDQSTPSAKGVARLLADALPMLERVDFPGVGHMGPITHPEKINAQIDEFLTRIAASAG